MLGTANGATAPRVGWAVPVLVAVSMVFATAGSALGAATSIDQWPRWSGPNHDLSAVAGLDAQGIGDQGIGLNVAWTVPLGSAYSGLVVADGLLVTGFADGDSDYLGAFDPATGAERWRYRLGKTYKGHDGSDDGPIATPILHEGMVYGLGAWGELVALDLADGSEQWRLALEEDLGGRKPTYGFSSTPTPVAGTLIVQAGGADGKSIYGLDPATGATRWSTGDDQVGYQSPIGMTIDGTELVLAITNRHLLGLDPSDGSELWRWDHGGEDDRGGSMQPVPAGEGRVLLTGFQGVRTVRIDRQGSDWSVEELWDGGLRSTWAFPVPKGDYVYGYAGQFLTCLEVETGEQVWKSRPPGGGTLMLVDDQLVILTTDGELVVADASPDGYRERARVAVLDDGYLTSPSFAQGRVYVRNLSQMAAITLGRGSGTEVAAEAALPDDALLGSMGDFVREVMALDAAARPAKVEAFVEAQSQFPILEGSHRVHFVFHGETEDLALGANFAANQQLPMHRIPGTDFYFHSVDLDPASHYTYNFFVFEETQPDPRNPRTFGGGEQPPSVVTTPGYETPGHFAEPTGARGTIETVAWESEILENEREVRVYLPAGHSADAGPYPLLVVNYGALALDEGWVDHTLDHLLGDSVEPLIAAFVPSVDWGELGGSEVPNFTRALAEELLPKLDAAYDLDEDPARRAIVGPLGGAFGSLYPALSQPGLFGKVGVFSYYFGDLGDEVETLLDAEAAKSVEVFAVWSRQDYQFRDYDTRAHGPRLVALAREKGATASSLELGDGYGWPLWRRGLAPMLERFFPAY